MVYGAEGYSEDGGSRFFQNVGDSGIITEKTAFSELCVYNSVIYDTHSCTYFPRLIQ